MKKFTSWLILGIIVVLFLALRLPQILRNEFPFVFDFGRDLIWVRNMVELRRPTLIGPWGSLAGVYFGPLWYYLVAIPYIIFSGDPRGPVYLTLTANLAVLLLGFFWLKKFDIKLGLIFAFLVAISPHLINLSTFAFHANMLPLTQLLFLYGLYQFTQGKIFGLYLAALLTSLNFHFEPATGIFTTLTLLIYLIWKYKSLEIRSIRLIRNSLIIFVLPFLPNLVFDLRHDFLQTRAVMAYFAGTNRSLEGVLPFPERIFERLRKFTELFSGSVLPNLSILLTGIILVTLLLVLWRIKKSTSLTQLIYLNYLILLISLFGFMFLFPPELKSWYLYGFSINYLILVSLFLSQLWRQKYWLALTLLLLLFFNNVKPLNRPDPSAFSTSATLKNQLYALDAIYHQAAGQPFNLYVYTPPIYDYHYQYLVWWYGRKTYGYLPTEYTYLPGEVSYHPQKEKFTTPIKVGEPDKVFLLIEPEAATDRLTGWLGHFASYPLLNQQSLPGNIILQIRQPKTTVAE